MYVDPDGRSVTDAHRYIIRYQSHIEKMAEKYDVPVNLINAVIYNENRVRELPHQIKDFIGVTWTGSASLGIMQVNVNIVTFLEPKVDPLYHGTSEYKDRELQKKASLMPVGYLARLRIAGELLDPLKNIEWGTRYLQYLNKAREGYETMELWLSDYNRGLTLEAEPSEYGKRYNEIKKEVEIWLKSQEDADE